ncbi:glycogen synthase [Cephaloticoccus primus]|uniref:Glycogen synthase n=1 Tax=Cephaloticoccus primus TaxID=1548207 RepID=A0A139SPK2_9BACT|nr:glycogen synthase GlgA [Cephaloticoccus primus]KXU36434.1 glycogen synthase [Cephaloticoccus primus]
MKIVHVASELFPYIKTGGLADAVAALGGALADQGHQVAIFLPGYRSVLTHPALPETEKLCELRIEMGQEFISGELRRFSPRPGLTVYLVCREEFFDRSFPYGNGARDYEDNAQRFLFFAKAVVETLRLEAIHADVVHAHDWQAALVPLLLRVAEQRHAQTLARSTVFTIHNIAFQGLAPLRVFAQMNLPREFLGVGGLEYHGQLSAMKGGILFADRVTTVSPRYASEIQTEAFGCGHDGVIRSRAAYLRGLLNGIDTAVWNPASDALLPARYSADDLTGKARCRSALLAAHGLRAAPPSVPIYGMVCRLTEQKGVELLLANAEFFLREECRLVILGRGEPRFEEAIQTLAARAPHKIAVSLKLDEAASHLIEAGADFFLMPSLFEPCGLNQMYSQAYGTVPVVSEVGGLADTVIDADRDAARGTGLCHAPTSAGMADALERSLALFADAPRYAAVQQRAMRHDFSWATAAQAYEALYRELLQTRPSSISTSSVQ